MSQKFITSSNASPELFDTFLELLPESVILEFVNINHGEMNFDPSYSSLDSMCTNASIYCAQNIALTLLSICYQFNGIYEDMPKDLVGIFICMNFFYRVHRYDEEVEFNLNDSLQDLNEKDEELNY